MKNKKVIISLSAALVIMLAIFSVIYATNRPKAQQGKKDVSITVVYSDGESKDYNCKTDCEFLGDVLHDNKLVTEEEYKSGFYTEIDGIKADYDKDQSWWCVTKDGEMTSVGMNEQPIIDGDKFEITYTIG